MTINTALRNVLADAFADLFDEGVLEIRTGAAPGPGNAATGTLLASVTLHAPAFAAAASGAVEKSGTWQDASADATGTAGHARLKSSDGTYVADLTLGTASADCIVNRTDFTEGGTFTVLSCTVTAPAS
jgi:hypothetical protein